MKGVSIRGEENGTSWNLQRRFYEEDCDAEFEIARPHECGELYDYLIERKFQTGCEVLGVSLAGRTLLEICAGSGMMSEKFARAGAIVTVTDFSPAAVSRARERARRYGFSASFAVADAERPPFPDRSFDIVAVHDGLHHLENPERAIREMGRVARRAVLIMDPAKAALTRAAVKVGIAEDVEDAGNEVKRLQPRAVAGILRECGLNNVRWQRLLMYYPHVPGSMFRRFDNRAAFVVARGLFAGANLIFGRLGNKLALAATVDGAPDAPRDA
jgi:SAM-dependent methyltransferase